MKYLIQKKKKLQEKCKALFIVANKNIKSRSNQKYFVQILIQQLCNQALVLFLLKVFLVCYTFFFYQSLYHHFYIQ